MAEIDDLKTNPQLPAMSQDESLEWLDSHTDGVLGSISRTGFPHTTYVSYVRRDNQLVITAGRTSQKVVNLRRDPRASFLIEVPEPYYEVAGLLVTGHVEFKDDRAYTIDIARETLDKHPNGLEIDPGMVADLRLCILLEMEKLVTWDARKLFAGT